MDKSFFSGIVPPIAVPIDSEERLDEARLRKHIDFMIDGGVSGILAFGSNGEFYMQDEDEQEEIDTFTREFLSKNGYERYEISNYAREGKLCRHNVGYWTEVPYLGFGIGAASYYDGTRWSNTRDINCYLEAELAAPEGLDSIRAESRRLTEADKMEEFMFLGLRMVNGVSETEFLQRFGRTMDNVYGRVLDKYVENGLIIREGYRYRLSERGMDISNTVLSDFLLDDQEGISDGK